MNFVKIWGALGGTPGHNNVDQNFIGHTPCVEVNCGKNCRYIFDAGSGFVDCAKSSYSIKGLFFSHFHLDHVQGLWTSDVNKYGDVYYGMPFVSGAPDGYTLDQALSQLMSPPLVPKALSWHAYKVFMSPRLVVVEDGGTFECEDEGHRVSFAKVVHGKSESYAMRFDEACSGGGKSVVYATDVDAGASHDKLVALAQNANLLIIDTHYTDAEYDALPSPRPHSCPRVAAAVAKAAKVKLVCTFHHGSDGYSPKAGNVLAEVRKHLSDPDMAVIGRTGFRIDL